MTVFGFQEKTYIYWELLINNMSFDLYLDDELNTFRELKKKETTV